jgi:gluconate 2-dehydrogenase gamma chain
LTGMVAAITCPVTVLSGDRDSAVPTDVVEREVVARLHRAQLVRVPGAGHLLPLESPGVVADAIRRMLARVSIEPAGIDSVRALSDSDWVTPPTRRALQERAAWRSQGPTFLSPDELVLLAAACDAMVPQDGPDDPGGVRYRVDIAGEIDRRLASGDGNGWRYDALPGDGDTYRLGLAAIDEAAGGRFRDLSRSDRLRMLTDIRAGAGDGPAWRSRGLDPRRVLEEWLADAVEVYYSHPGGGYADLGYAGFADARGWRHVQLNQLDRQETPLPPN